MYWCRVHTSGGGEKTKNDADNKSSIKTWRVKMIYFQFLKLLKVMKVWISKRCHYYSSCVLISMLELASLCCVTDFRCSSSFLLPPGLSFTITFPQTEWMKDVKTGQRSQFSPLGLCKEQCQRGYFQSLQAHLPSCHGMLPTGLKLL